MVTRYYQSRTSEVYGGTISLIALATLLVIARLAARRISAAKLWWDDVLLVAALVSRGTTSTLSRKPKLTLSSSSVTGDSAHATGCKLYMADLAAILLLLVGLLAQISCIDSSRHFHY